MSPIVLYCKSFHVDVLRVQRLARSVQLHNVERIPFYVSVPRQDVPLFAEKLAGLAVELICDDDILRANPRHITDCP